MAKFPAGGRSRMALTITILVLAACAPAYLAGRLELRSGIQLASSEQVAFDPASRVAYVIGGATLTLVNLRNLSSPAVLATINTTTEVQDVNICIRDGVAHIALAKLAATKLANGTVELYQVQRVLAERAFNVTRFLRLRDTFTVGAHPDQLVFSSNCTRLFTANEGEPDASTFETGGFDPEGSVSIIELGFRRDGTYRPGSGTVHTAGFTQFNSAPPAGVRTRYVAPGGPTGTFSSNMEPEYVALSPDNVTAYVTLQENNAIATINITSRTITKVTSLGFKDHLLPRNALDPSDRDPRYTPDTPAAPGGCPGAINIRNWPVKGLYMPDGLKVFRHGGEDYLITGNEGDGREWGNYNDEISFSSAANINLINQAAFPNLVNGLNITNSAALGRLRMVRDLGLNSEGKYDEFYAYGARSFSIWRASDMAQVYDSGSELESLSTGLQFDNTTSNPPQLNYVFNSEGAPFQLDATGTAFSLPGGDIGCDTRSDNKGPEPEEVLVAQLGSTRYAVVGAERNSGLYLYNITVPASSTFSFYAPSPVVNGTRLRAPEGMMVTQYTPPGGSRAWPAIIVCYEATGASGLGVFELRAR